MPPEPPPSRWGRAYSQSRTGSPVQAEGENGALPPRRVVGLETARARLPARLSLSRNDRGRRPSRGSPEHWPTPVDVARDRLGSRRQRAGEEPSCTQSSYGCQ